MRKMADVRPVGLRHPGRKVRDVTAWPVGAKDGDSHALSPKSYSSWPAVGAFAP